MKERSILFSGDMVQAILEGKKSQTRRPIKLQHGAKVFYDETLKKWLRTGLIYSLYRFSVKENVYALNYPYGEPGDRLWVKETWGIWQRSDSPQNGEPYDPCYIYRATDEKPNIPKFRWRPSLYMPRRASRILLEVDEIRVERLQDITEDDAKAEGVVPSICPPYDGITHKAAFMTIWDSIYSGKGLGWEANPPVWVGKFHVLEVRN